MVIDLAKCVGCEACTVACKVENTTPPGIWYAPVFHKEVGKFPRVKRIFIPTLCNHCKDAPCLKACPTAAISKRADGIVLIDQNKCCGSRACMAACPYGAIHFHDSEETHYDGTITPLDEMSRKKYQIGTTQKCTFCVHRIDAGVAKGLRPGGENGVGLGALEATPACVITCPANCRIFGDMDDPRSAVSMLLRERNSMAPRAEAGTEPSVLYLL